MLVKITLSKYNNRPLYSLKTNDLIFWKKSGLGNIEGDCYIANYNRDQGEFLIAVGKTFLPMALASAHEICRTNKIPMEIVTTLNPVLVAEIGNRRVLPSLIHPLSREEFSEVEKMLGDELARTWENLDGSGSESTR